MKRLGPTSLAILSALLVTPAAFAGDAAGAEQLYQDADKLMKAGQFTEACPKLEESQRLDPGTGTLIKLGECYESSNRFASAWATFTDAQSREVSLPSAGDLHDKRLALLRKHLDLVEPKRSRLSIVVPDAVSALDGLEIRRDGVLVGRVSWRSPMPVDAGSHTLEARATGYLAWRATIEVAVQATATVTVPMLGGDAAPAAVVRPLGIASVSPSAPATAQSSPPPSPRTEEEKRDRTAPWIGALSMGAAGIASVGVGVYLLHLQSTDLDDARSYCATPCTKAQAEAANVTIKDDVDRSNRDRHGAIASFVLGGALLAGGAALIVGTSLANAETSKRAPEWTAWTASGGGGVAFTTGW